MLAEQKGLDFNKLIQDEEYCVDDYKRFIRGDIPKKIRNIRAACECFMGDFGRLMGFDNAASAISQWEAGNSVPMRYWFPEIKKAAANKRIDLNALNGHPEIYKDPFTELIQKQDSEEWVRRIRKQCGLTVDAFARYIGVSRSTVNSWETHQNCRKPSRESFNRIVEMAKMRGVDIYDPWRTETLADPATSERKE